MATIKANDPSLHSWITIAPNSDFPIQNLPYGIFRTELLPPRMGVAIGEYVLDLHVLAQHGLFDRLGLEDLTVFDQPTLNAFIALGRPVWRAVRDRVSQLLRHDNGEIRDNEDLMHTALLRQREVEMLLPVHVPNYTDFYSSIEHATNVGTMFRDPANALLPNWRHLPVGYHGRASSIVVSGVPITRPKGQFKPADAEVPLFGPTRQLDFELEMAFIIGKESALGSTISTTDADDFIFGMVLFNDWSARDIQAWEYVPLGPFLGKNFGSSVSPWVVTLDALEPFRVPGPEQNPPVLPYLQYQGDKNIDIQLEVLIQPETAEPSSICHSNYRYMYWNMEQQLAHHTINGCNVQIGDMYASGTISGPVPDSYGSMLELCWRGTRPITLTDGSTRTFINDLDTVIMRAHCEKDGLRIGFGEVRAQVMPAV